jgi:DNA-binding response OmpR family regulator
MRVLVAEDERLMADAIAEGLRRRSMAVDVCYDGDAALERVTVHRYDAVILDRDLPKVHGDEVCKHIVAAGSETRMLMLTAAAGIRDRVDGLDLGADDYLTKPFAFAELRNTGQVVPSEAMPALFEPFRRLTADRTNQGGGGLGLSIVRSITTAHGGSVRAQPRPGGGLIVEIDLPLATYAADR